MALIITATQARFEEVCTVEDALPLLEFLRNNDKAEVGLHLASHRTSAISVDRQPEVDGVSCRSRSRALGRSIAR